MNRYSPLWFQTFMESIDPAQTKREVEFLSTQLPLPAFRRVLDVCCGTGRHALALAHRGYEVIGIDIDEAAIARARVQCPPSVRVRYEVHDMHRVGALVTPASMDAVLCLWQSFGHFDPATNDSVLKSMVELVRPGGRLVLDIYNRAFFETRLGERVLQRDGRRIIERKAMRGDRLTITLEYDPSMSVMGSVPSSASQPHDVFDWQVFTLPEITRLLEGAGLEVITACSRFDASAPVVVDEPRMQVVSER